MNILANMVKLVAGMGGLILVLVINASLYITNFINVDTALELLNTEKRPVVYAPGVGLLLAALAPQATIADWLALSIASAMFVGALFAFHYVFKIGNLLLDARSYRRGGQVDLSAAAHELVIRELAILVPLVLLMLLLIRGDLFLFTYARTAAAMNIDDPNDAVQAIDMWGELSDGPAVAAAMWFAQVSGPKMYLALSLLTPSLLEVVTLKIGQTANRLWAAVMAPGQPEDGDASATADAPRQLYGYDANGIPVYDRDTAIAYDVDQQPLVTGPAAAQPAPSGNHPGQPTTADTPSAADERLTVIGGRPGDTVTLAQAQQKPAQYHVDRATRRVYQRAYWDALNPDRTKSKPAQPAEAP